MLNFWPYRSIAKVPARSGDDALIFLQARDRNAAHEISGYLHRENGYYCQYVEGPADAPGRLRRVIRNDWRHKDLHVMAEGRVPTRRFSGWDMAFTDAETSSFRVFQGVAGGEPDIGRASAEAILTFMERTALSGKARSVAELA